MDQSAVSVVDEDNFISPELFANTIASMHSDHKFRRMFIAVDACQSGVLGPALEAANVPDVILFTAAAETESSFSTNYAPSVKQWVADEFSFDLLQHVVHTPTSHRRPLRRALRERREVARPGDQRGELRRRHGDHVRRIRDQAALKAAATSSRQAGSKPSSTAC